MNVTRLFSKAHEKFEAAKDERMVVAFRGIPKLDWEVVITLETLVPRVTLRSVSLGKSAVLQSDVGGCVHVEPVKPLTQIQPQWLPTTRIEPPFAHGCVDRQLAMETAPCVVLLSERGMTMRMMGMTTAAAAKRRRTSKSKTNAQIGKPQHLRRGFGFSEE